MTEAAVAWGEDSSDAELITAARAGDSSAFGALYERHAAAARMVARQYTRSTADAEDVVGDAFAKVYAIVRGGGGPDVAFRAYLFTVVRRLAQARAESGRRVQPTDDMATFESAFGPVGGVDDPALAGFERGVVARAYGSLPERWQAVLWYTEIERLPTAQIAPLLGLTPNGVAALAYRAREGLREAYLQQHLVAAPQLACRTINSKLGAYVRGGLAKRETAQVQEHLEGCAECRMLVLELGDVNHGLRGIIAPLVLGVAGLGALASPLPVGVLGAGGLGGVGAAGAGAAGAAGAGTGAGAGTTAGAAVGSGSAVGAGSGAAAGGAGAAGAGSAAGTGSAVAGATGAGAATSATSVGVGAGSAAGGAAAAGSAGAAAGAGAAGTAAGAAAGSAAGAAAGSAAGAAAGTAGAAGAGAVSAVGTGAAASGLGVTGALGGASAGATLVGASGATAAGATALVGAGAGATGGGVAAGAGIGGLISAIPGGVAGAVTAGVVGVSLAVGGAIVEEPAAPVGSTQSQTAQQDPGPRTPSPVEAPGPAPVAPQAPVVGDSLFGSPVLPPQPVPAPAPEQSPVAGSATDPAPPVVVPVDPGPVTPPPADPPPVEPPPVDPPPVDPPPTPASLALAPEQAGLVLVPGTEQEVTVTVVNTGQTSATDLRAALVLPEGVRIEDEDADEDEDLGEGPDAVAEGAWQRCADDEPGGPAEFCLPALAGGGAAPLTAVVVVDEALELPVDAVVALAVTGTGVPDTTLTVPVSRPAPDVEEQDEPGEADEPVEPARPAETAEPGEPGAPAEAVSAPATEESAPPA